MATIESQVKDPSVAATLFQCRAVLERISDGFPRSGFPAEAIRILRIFELLIQRVESRLLVIQEQRGRDAGTGELRPLEEFAVERANHLGDLLRRVYSCLRFIHASDPQSTPPEIQTAVSRLVQEYVIRALGCAADSVVVLVRPRWTGPNFVDLLGYLEQQIEVADLDPAGETHAETLRSLIEHDWRSRDLDGSPPRYVAVISFAGSDAHDALLYPLLAHEIGHFLGVAFGERAESPSPLAPGTWVIGSREVQELFDVEYPPPAPAVAEDDYRRVRVRELQTHTNRLVEICLSEIVSDLLATRMLGVAYFIALAEYLKTVSGWPEEAVTESGYPGLAFRLRLVFEELTAAEAGIEAVRGLERIAVAPTDSALASVRRTISYLNAWEGRLRPPAEAPGARYRLFAERLCVLVHQKVVAALPQIRQFVRAAIPRERVPQIPEYFGDLVALLENRVTPAQPLLQARDLANGPTNSKFSDVLAAGWVYELGTGEVREDEAGAPDKAYREYQNTCQLLFKAVELQGAQDEVLRLAGDPRPQPPLPEAARGAGTSVASGPCILEAMLREIDKRLFVVPYYGAGPVNAATLDLHLGNWFRIAQRTRSTAIDVSNGQDRARVRREAQQEEYVRFRGEFALHPGDFALGVSLEYFAIPPDLMAFVEGKSSLGRTGLIVATATQVAPGFKGGIVLELFNAGTVPLLLRPGMSIAQLVFVHTDRPLPSQWLYTGRFRCQVKP